MTKMLTKKHILDLQQAINNNHHLGQDEYKDLCHTALKLMELRVEEARKTLYWLDCHSTVVNSDALHDTIKHFKAIVSRGEAEKVNPHNVEDECIRELINALNDAGYKTIASCCGHGNQPTRISLKNGRELFITDYEKAQKISAVFPWIHAKWTEGE